MKNWTDEQFRSAGWLWVMRKDGAAVACTMCHWDATTWVANGEDVTFLGDNSKEK